MATDRVNNLEKELEAAKIEVLNHIRKVQSSQKDIKENNEKKEKTVVENARLQQ